MLVEIEGLLQSAQLNKIDEKSFVWILDHINEDGVHRTHVTAPQHDDFDGQLQKLEDMGLTHVWVTPKIPFIVFTFIGFLLTLMLGNVIIVIMHALIY